MAQSNNAKLTALASAAPRSAAREALAAAVAQNSQANALVADAAANIKRLRRLKVDAEAAVEREKTTFDEIREATVAQLENPAAPGPRYRKNTTRSTARTRAATSFPRM